MESDPDGLVEYLLANIDSVLEEHGDPSSELLSFIVSEFIKTLMWDKDSLNTIIRIWGKFPPPGAKGAIGMFQSIFHSLTREKIDLFINPSYVQIFRDSPTLRIPRTVISERSLRYLRLFEHESAWHFFFKRRKDVGFEDSCVELDGCKFNSAVENNLDRGKLVRIIIYKTVGTFMMIDQEKHLIDVIQCLVAALQNCLNVQPLIREGRIQKPREWTDEDSGLVRALSILGNPLFYSTMLESLDQKRK